MKEQLQIVRNILIHAEPSTRLRSGSLVSTEKGFECSFDLSQSGSKVHFEFCKNQCEWTVSKKRGFFSFTHPSDELDSKDPLISLFLRKSLHSDWQVARDKDESIQLLKSFLHDEGYEVEFREKNLSKFPSSWTPYYPKKSKRLEIQVKQFHLRWRVCLPSSDSWLQALHFFLRDVLCHTGHKIVLT